MSKVKKILSPLIKVVLGLACFSVIWYRLAPEFSAQNLTLLSHQIFTPKGFWCLIAALVLIPVNWGIEAYKWQLITKPVQAITYQRATRSVYAGVCVGNLAPGRATEFLAKIFFFDAEKRSQVTVLHFVGGLFQLSITIIAGFAALYTQVHLLAGNLKWLQYLLPVLGGILILALIAGVWKINFLLQYASKRLNRNQETAPLTYQFTGSQLFQLFVFSALRYVVFLAQFYFLLALLSNSPIANILSGIALYFLITTILPMFSAIEAAVRAAVALVVLKDSGISATGLALSSVLLWIINIIVPSIVGYVFLIRENFDFKLVRARGKK